MGLGRRKLQVVESDGIRLPEGFTGLLITTPCYSGFTNLYLHSKEPTSTMLVKLGIPNALVTLPGEAEISRARDSIMAYFMSSKHSHMLCIDSDVGWRKEDVLRLLLCGHEIVMGTYPRKIIPAPGERQSFPIHWMLPEGGGQLETCPKCGVVKIKGGPAGFMMIRRSVGEKMAVAYPDLKYEGEGATADVSQYLYGFYNNIIEDRVRWSEDLSFCMRWRAIGGEVWLDPEIVLDHQGQYIFKGSVKDLLIPAEKDNIQQSGAA